MDKKEKYKLLSELNKVRTNRHELNYENIFKELDRPLTFEELKFISDNLSYSQGVMFIPSHSLVNFISKLFELNDSKSIFDPNFYPGSLGHQIAQNNNSELFGIQKNVSLAEISNIFYSDSIKELTVADPQIALAEHSKVYDNIISLIPLNLRIGRRLVKVNDQNVKVKTLSESIILQSLNLYHKCAIFLVPNSFFFKNNNIINNLNKAGHAIKAIINLKSGSLPNTTVSSNLILLKKSQQEEVFVAQYTENSRIQDKILKKFLDKSDDRNIVTGQFIELSSYKGFNQLKLEHILDKRLNRLNFPNRKILQDISYEINLGSSKENFTAKNNSIYIPKLGNSKVVTSLSNLNLKQQNYVQVVLNEEECINEYVANLLNHSLGMDLLNSKKLGYIPSLSLTRLKKMKLPYHNQEVQKRCVGLQDKISNMKNALKDSQKKLWNEFNTNKVNNTLNKINKDPFDIWIKNLPNPLSILLVHFDRQKSLEKKFEYLLYFFEAYTELNFSILFSLLKNNKDFYDRYKSEIFTKKDLDYLKKASFGTWIQLNYKLSKFIRTQYNDKEKTAEITENFNNIRYEELRPLTSKQNIHILREVLKIRNDWKAHSGPIPRKVLKELLEKMLHSLKHLVSNTLLVFYNMDLFLANSMEFSGGEYFVLGETIKGAVFPFEKKQIVSNIPLDKDEIFICFKERIPIKLVHFITMQPSSEKQKHVCYFYNRLDKKGARYISYAHASKPTDYFDFKDISNFINEDLRGYFL